jgi:cell division protein FtsZ
VTARPVSRFASEMECQPAGTSNVEVKPASDKVEVQSELIPVPASVFDDDFFRTGEKEGKTLDTGELSREVYDRYSETAHFKGSKFVQKEDVSGVREELTVLEAAVVPASFGVAVSEAKELSEPDELDIPAFLRRGK